MTTLKIRGRYVFAGVGILTLGYAVWFWLTTWVSVDYWSFPDSCPLHHAKPVSEFEKNHGGVTISYGFDWITVKGRLFPLDTFNDGYGHPNQRYRRIFQKYCPDCRRARLDWMHARQASQSRQ